MLQILKKLFGGTSVDYKDLMSNGAIVVDVRTPGEYKTGHVPGSRNIPLDTMRKKVADLKKLNKPVITVCRSGSRSGVAKGMLKSAGIEVYNGGPWTSLRSKLK
jgi:phage shock protein E